MKRRRRSSSRNFASTDGTFPRRPRRSIRRDRICTRRSSSTESSAKGERELRRETAPPNSAIGVFDSGVGGLTVFREIARVLPHLSLIYLGESARVPYGPKSPAIVERYAMQAANHLVRRGI